MSGTPETPQLAIMLTLDSANGIQLDNIVRLGSLMIDQLGLHPGDVWVEFDLHPSAIKLSIPLAYLPEAKS